MPERRNFLIQSFYLLCLCFVVNYRFLVGMFLCEKDSLLDKLFLLLFQLFRQIINHLYEISTLLTLSEDVILHSFVKFLGFRDSLLVKGLEAHLALNEWVEHSGKLIEYWLETLRKLVDSLHVMFDFAALLLVAISQINVCLC